MAAMHLWRASAAARAALRVCPLFASSVRSTRCSSSAATPVTAVAPTTVSRRLQWPVFVSELPDITPQHARVASSIFRHGARYMGDATTCISTTERPKWLELALFGRSNVGKSSLLNALIGADGAAARLSASAHVSRTPGSTLSIHFYGLGTSPAPEVCLVDTPGYGFAAGGKRPRAEWSAIIGKYLRARSPDVLGRAVLLIDSRAGVTDLDRDAAKALDDMRTPWMAVLTKCDDMKDGALQGVAMTTCAWLAKHSLVFPVLTAVSAHTREGMTELQNTLVLAGKLHRRPAFMQN